MMNDELLDLIRRTGYLTDAPLTAQQRFDLLTTRFWREAGELGYDVTTLKTKLWRAASRPEEALVAILPEARIQKAVNAGSKEKDPGRESSRPPWPWHCSSSRVRNPSRRQSTRTSTTRTL